MPGSKELYDKLYSEQLYTNSYNDFVAKYGNEEGQNELYKKLSEQELYTNDINTFKSKYFSDVKKKDVGASVSSSDQPIGLSASPRNPSAYNKGIESRDWQAHQALTRSLQEAAQKNDAVGIKNAQSQLEQLRASNPTIASDPLLNEDLQTANKFIKAAPVPQQPAVKFPTRDRIPDQEVDKAIKGKAYVDVSQLVQPGNLNVDEKVSEFNKEFGSLGVRFEKTDNPIASNFEGQITAIADNGEQMPVMIYRNELAAKKEKEKLQEFLFRNSGGVNKKELTPTQFLSMAENGVSPEDENKFKRLYTKENVDKSLKFVNEQLQYSSNTMNDIKKEIDDINKEAEAIAAIVSTQGMTPELKAKADDIQLRYNEKSKEFENQKNHAKTVFSLADAGTKSLAAQNVKLLKEEGNIFGALYNSLLSGSKSLASGAVYAALEGTDILTMGLTNDAQKTQYEKDANKWLTDKFNELKLSSTTEEYKNDPNKKIRSALFSVPEMFPAFTIPGGFVAGMTLQGIGRRMEEYDNNPEMKNVPKEEKFILSGLNSFVEAKLENVGITQAFSKAGLANSLLLKSMAKWAPKSGINGLNRILNTEINNLAIKGTLNTAGAMIAEGETGALQSASEMASNELYNIAKEKQIFKNPNTTKELLGKVWEDAEMEALGGMWMAGVVNIATNTAQYTLGKMLDNQTFKLAKTIINDKATKASFVADLKTKIAKGEITQEKAQSLLTSFNEANAIVSQMPENISVENQRKAYDLIAEKRKLASQIEGKDPNLTAKPRERIKQIDVELTNISNATQEEEVNEPIQEEVKQKPVIKEESQVKINELADSLKNDIEFEKKNNKNKKNNKYIKVLEDELNLLTTNPEEYLKQKISELSKDAEFESSTNYYKNLLENLYAIQEQGSGQVPVQPETGVSQEVEQGVPESKPQVVAEESNKELEKEIKIIEENKQNEIEQKGLNKLMPIVLDESDPGYQENKKQIEERDLALIEIDKKYNDQIEKAKSRVQEAKAPSIEEEGTRVPEQKAEGVTAEPTIEEEAKKKSAFDQVEGGVEAKQKSLDTFEKTRKRGQKTFAEARENAISTLKKTFAYEKADDIQREEMERELRTELGEKLKKAPSVNKILGKIKDITKVTVNEAVALKEQIKLQAKAAKGAVKYVNELRNSIMNELKDLQKKGKISTKQLTSLLKAASRLNVQNPLAVSRFVDRMIKVFNDAEYAEKVSEAQKIAKRIAKSIKNADVQPSNRNMAKNFLLVNPRDVDNIDEYLDKAKEVLMSVASNAKLKTPADIEAVNKYSAAQIEQQNQKRMDEMKEKYQELFDAGILSDNMTEKEMLEAIKNIDISENEEQQDEEVVKTLAEIFDDIKDVAKQILETGEDPITGEKVDLTEAQKSIIKKFLELDLSVLSNKEAKLAVERLDNFINNYITEGMEGLVNKAIGAEAAKELEEKGVKSRSLRLYFSTEFANYMAAQAWQIHKLLETMFVGQSKDRAVSSVSGIYDFEEGVNRANTMADEAIDAYVEKFGKEKEFFTLENNYERGIAALLFRDNGDEDYFEDQKTLIQQSIDVMLNSKNNKKVKKGELAQKVFDKLIKDAKNGQEVIDNTSKTNRDAVLWWINNWDNHYSDFEEVSKNVYNDDLGRDANFTSKTYKKADPSKEKEDVSLSDNVSAYRMTTGDYTVKSKSGSLIKTKKVKTLPKNRVLSFDFDINQANAFRAALVDVKTAAPIRQLEGFINSPSFMKLGPEEDMQLLKSRINTLVAVERGKSMISKSDYEKAVKLLKVASAIGTTRALLSIGQPISQTAPVALNTLINSGFRLMFLNKAMKKFINSSGMAVANRGAESSISLSNENKIIEDASKNKGLRTISYISKLPKKGLSYVLSKPDVGIAKMSFIAYYAQRIGKRVYQVDWNEEAKNPNKDALRYAQQMVDRQQSPSNPNQMGNLFTSRDPLHQAIRMIAFPLAVFNMNQKARMQSDIITLAARKQSTAEDKKAAALSLAGLMVEMGSFLSINGAKAYLLYNLSLSLMGLGGEDKEEEKKKKFKRIMTNASGTIATDLLSPLPISNSKILDIGNFALDKYYGYKNEGKEEYTEKQKEEIKKYQKEGWELPEKYKSPMAEEPIQFYSSDNIDETDLMGTAGIAIAKIIQSSEYEKTALTGKFEKESYGGKKITKYLLPEDQKVLKEWAAIPALYNIGFMPAELNAIANNLMQIAQKRALTEKEMEKSK
jgi:hypothetical protein